MAVEAPWRHVRRVRPALRQRRDGVSGFVHAGRQFVRAIREGRFVRAEVEFVRAIFDCGSGRRGGRGFVRAAMGDSAGMPRRWLAPCSIRSASQRSRIGSTISLRRRRSAASCSTALARVAVDPAAVADQGGERGQAGRRLLAALGPRQHRILDRAQPHLPPGGEHQLLDQMRLGRVHGLPARRAARRAGPRARRASASSPDHGPGAQAVAGGVHGRAGLALGRRRGRATGHHCGGRSRRGGRRIAGRAWAWLRDGQVSPVRIARSVRNIILDVTVCEHGWPLWDRVPSAHL